jgi:hypothetical protein
MEVRIAPVLYAGRSEKGVHRHLVAYLSENLKALGGSLQVSVSRGL